MSALEMSPATLLMSIGTLKSPTKLSCNLKIIYLNRSLPEEPNGVITGYRLYFMSNNFTDVQTVQATSNHMQYTLESLSQSTILYFKSDTQINLRNDCRAF